MRKERPRAHNCRVHESHVSKSKDQLKPTSRPSPVTDGGTTTSKYVIPTGQGYVGTYKVRPNRSVTISTGAFTTKAWTANTSVTAVDHKDGIILIPESTSENALAEYTCVRRYGSIRLSVGTPVTTALELDPGDRVRIYDLEHRDAFLLVDAANDPRRPVSQNTPTTQREDQ